MLDQRKHANSPTFTIYGWTVCFWILIIAFQYGYHIPALNQIQAVLTCKEKPLNAVHYGLPTCISMSEFAFSVVTAIFTVGGLLGSLIANLVMDRWGRRGAVRTSTLLTSLGAGIMGMSGSFGLLCFGRLLVGIGSGVGLCVGPIFLAEIAPSNISGNVGVLTQLGIVLGIMITQAMGLRFATPTEWRLVLIFSSVLSAAQLLLSVFIVESPTWLGSQLRTDEKKWTEGRLWDAALQNDSSSTVERDFLLDQSEAQPEAQRNVAAITVPQLLTTQELRTPLAIICLAMASQQLSGINAVLYYSNAILSKSLPDFGPYVSLGITVVNVLMTFPPIILIERMGRRQLLMISTIGALTSLTAVGFGLNTGLVIIPSLAILVFVMSFAVGLGPIPFVMIPEVSPGYAVSALSSVALSLNWIVNFMVGLLFLPLRNQLSGGDSLKEGRVFYVFVGVLFMSTFALSRLYRR
ncbi:general substrate transporter [Collybia nuda]|uniref:General substrate transporter n=1 Tax=Collybia nuda TaxID=64659 RepID=A0A9P5XX51_9AGAR|nr:general substrate transporter [Collybia nuda]